MLDKGEILLGKRVVMSIDGGCICIRDYEQKKKGKKSYYKFDSSRKEFKLFVIIIIDKEGKIDKKFLLIYDVIFDEKFLFDLFGQYFKVLNISEVLEVQVIGDGAFWIWNNVKKFLMNLGVGEDKIIEIFDYYYVVEYLKRIIVFFFKNK